MMPSPMPGNPLIFLISEKIIQAECDP